MGPGVYTETVTTVLTQNIIIPPPIYYVPLTIKLSKTDPPNSMTFMALFPLTDLLSSKIFLPHCTKYLTLILALSLPSIR